MSNTNQLLVINTSKLPQTVPIERQDGSDATNVFLMAPGRAELEAGYVVNANWIALNPRTVRVVTPKQKEDAIAALSPVVVETPAADTSEDTDTATDEGAQ